MCVFVHFSALVRHSCMLRYSAHTQTVLSVLWKVWSCESVIDYESGQPHWTSLATQLFCVRVCACIDHVC